MAEAERTREEIYDAEISPLMVQVIAIAKRAGIPMHADFELDDDEDEGPMRCTTHIPTGASADWKAMYTPCTAGAPSPMLAITTRDAAGNVKSIEHIVGGPNG